MDASTARAYLLELERQCAFALNAAAHVQQASSARRSTDRWTTRDETYRGLHSLLAHASNVSRLLWPDSLRPGVRQRATVLRALLALGDGASHPLRTGALRHHLERFDERLDMWIGAGRRGQRDNDVIALFETVESPERDGVPRVFDPDSGIFSFRGERFDVAALVAGMRDVHALVQDAIAELAAVPYAYVPSPSGG